MGSSQIHLQIPARTVKPNFLPVMRESPQIQNYVMEDRDDFITIELKTEGGEVFRVPVLRSADEILIGFYPRESETQRDVFCLMTKQFRENRLESFACFGSRCAMCGEPYIRSDSTDTCDECSVKKYRDWELTQSE